jgi:serine/threonine protein kinase
MCFCGCRYTAARGNEHSLAGADVIDHAATFCWTSRLGCVTSVTIPLAAGAEVIMSASTPSNLPSTKPVEQSASSQSSTPNLDMGTTPVPTPADEEAIRRYLAAGAPLIPGYDVLGELGRGGMGIVYKARQVGLNRVVALKMILEGAFTRRDIIARFKKEAEAEARLQHPNIVQIFEIGELFGRPYFSFEYVEGGTLGQRLAGNPLQPEEAARITEILANAVHAAHLAGIIHRDLKPANILITRDGIPKITDFGLSKHLDANSELTTTGAVFGTPSYMAPEQALGETRIIRVPTDIYALGAILYEMLTGRPPFRGPTALDTLEQVRSEEPVSPRRLQPKVPRDLELICLKCLEKEPRQRYASALELAADLQRFLDGQTVLAVRGSSYRGLTRWLRRVERIREAGRMMIVIGLTTCIFSVLHLFFSFVPPEQDPWYVETRTFFASCLIAGLFQAMVGVRTLTKSQSALWVGWCLTATYWIYPLFRILVWGMEPLAEQLPQEPRIMRGILPYLPIFAIPFITYSIALRAYYAHGGSIEAARSHQVAR